MNEKTQEVAELIEEREAISEVLRAIASSPHELQPIFDTILAKATRLCQAKLGILILFAETGFRIVARRGGSLAVAERYPEGLIHPISPGSSFARLANIRSVIQTADLAADPAYLECDSGTVAAVELSGGRTELVVPMLNDDELVGAIGILRGQVQPFADRQIDLITDFAAQATIALESTRRERQYRQVLSELAHANRVGTMGQLTASIAHELKQPIASAHISASAALRFLDKDLPDLAEVRDALARIVRDTDRAGEVVNRIGALFKKAQPRKEVLDLNEAILEVTALTHGEAVKSGVTVRTQLEPRLPRIQGDRVQLQQVMLNLIVNAIQAMSGVGDGGRELHISTEVVEPKGVRVGVRDFGPGLAPATFPRLFEPFYTTKPDGMGMGLSICRSIIEAHEGRLWATACEPSGALFQFTVPMAR